MTHPDFACKGSARMEQTDSGLWFTVQKSPPRGFRHKSAVVRSYLEATRVYRLPIRIDMTVSLDAPGFCVMLGDLGRVCFCSPWSDNRRIQDIADPPPEGKDGKPMFYANQMPLHTPTRITIIYNLKSMQILIDGQQRYHSVKERYMKSKAFPALNDAGFPIRLSAAKRTEVVLHSFTVTEGEADFPLEPQADMPDPVISNIPVRPGDKPSLENITLALGGKPTFDAMIANLPAGIRAKVIEVDGILRGYKPIKFRRTLEKNGNKITYVASDCGVSYAIHLSRDMLTHSVQWYILTNSRENWGKRVANDFIATLDHLAEDDAAFADRIFSYLRDCCGCYGPGCGARSPYTYAGKTTQSCHGCIEFKMSESEFDDALRLIRAIR